MNTSISTTNFSDRVKDALHGAGIHTVEQLKAMPREQLMLIRHMGKRSLTEIEDFLYDEDFPQDDEDFLKEDEDSQPLMASQATMRDYFAANAMTALMLYDIERDREGRTTKSWEDMAKSCYVFADAMLKAREQ